MNRFLSRIFSAFLVAIFLLQPSLAQCNLAPCVKKPPCPPCISALHQCSCEKNEDCSQRRRVLSIDGGGIKSIITLKMLDYIEKKTGKKTGDFFDYIAGTSSGGLLALYLSMPSEHDPMLSKYSASDVIDLLKHDSKQIFKRKPISWITGQKLLQIFRPAYHNDNIESVMANRFYNLKIEDATTNVLVLTFDTQENVPVAFTNYKDFYKDAYMREVAIGTSVAPFYLSPLLYHDKKLNKDRTLIDGGLVAKNASVFAYCEAKNLFPKDDLFVLSLGAGYQEKKQYDYNKLKGWGFFRLALPIYTFMLDGTSNTNDLYMQKLAEASKNDRYYRFQPKYSKDKSGFDNKPDNTSDENFNLLLKMADMYIMDHQPELDAMVDDLLGKKKESI